MKIKLATALLRRKELQEKVDQLRAINTDGLFEIKVKRQPVTENVDNIIANVPRISLNQVTAGFDYYARRLRLVDATIQQANWTTEIDVDETVMQDFVEVLDK